MRSRLIFIFGIVLMALAGCDSSQVYDQYETIDGSWSKDNVLSFNFEAPDTINNYDLFINIRNTSDYQFNNLFLIVEMQYPHGKVEKDTLEYRMAAADGTLLGEGFTDIKENKLVYKGMNSSFVFSEEGEYEVRVEHAMRENGEVKGIQNLNGIIDVGFRIERTQN